MHAGDAKTSCNTGCNAFDDILRMLLIASCLLGVSMVMITNTTNCPMTSTDEATNHSTIKKQFNVNTSSLELRRYSEQRTALTTDPTRLRSCRLFQKGVPVADAIQKEFIRQLKSMNC
jgi:carbonic anhydrase